MYEPFTHKQKFKCGIKPEPRNLHATISIYKQLITIGHEMFYVSHFFCSIIILIRLFVRFNWF
jgi:hypothetical protein